MSSLNLKPLSSIDIVISVHNQEQLIQRVLVGIFNSTTTPFNLILVFDGCTDKSLDVSQQFLKNTKSSFLKNLAITTADNVYETKANNIGFRLSREKYLITLQDDVVIEEKGWERRLTYPLRAFDDIFAVTSRVALNMRYFDDKILPRYVNCAGREFLSLPRNTFAIRNTLNRGPIAFRVDILKQLGYLDEIFAPGQFDEADLVLRAQEQHQMKCGAFSVDYQSDLNWGKTRTGLPNIITSRANTIKNAKLLHERHPRISTDVGSVLENRIINEKDIDYITRDSFIKREFVHMRASRRFLVWYLSRKYRELAIRLKSKIFKLAKKKPNSISSCSRVRENDNLYLCK